MVMLNKPIEMIALFDKKGMPRPYKFRIENDDGSRLVYKVESVLFSKKESVNKAANIIVRCKGNIDGVIKIYEMKFIIESSQWILFKI